MTKQNIQYSVKVLTGVNEGATAELSHTSGVVIGRSVGCDIIFNGANVADRHVAVELEGSQIRLTPLAQPVYIDGKDVGSHEVILRPNQLVNIGEVKFTIAAKNQPWPDVDLANNKLSVIDGRGDVNEGVTKSSLIGNPWLWVAVAAMLLANIHYLTKDYGGIFGLLGLKKTVEQQVSSVVNVGNFPDLYIRRLEDGTTEVKGYVETKLDSSLVNDQLSKLGDTVHSHVFVDTEIEESARNIAHSLGENEINFSTLEHGRLKASGLVENRDKWMRVKESIRSDVQGVTSVNDDEVRNLHEMFVVLERRVNKEYFSKRLALELRNKIIVVKGKLTDKEKLLWMQIKKEFLSGSFYPFKFREILRAPDADIKLSIRSVSVGDVPFVVSKEGNKYFQGSHVGSGYYIESINDNHILLKNNNIEFPVYFGQKKGNN